MKNSIECATEEFSRNLDSMKEARLASLADTIELETMMRTLLQYEVIRIKQKFGVGHRRVENLDARLKDNLELINTLNVEREAYAVDVPEVSEDSTLVHGRVVDENHRGIRGLVVCLIDEQSRPANDAVDSVTDDSGYYAVSLDAASVERIRKGNPNGVFLAVLSPGGELLNRERKPRVLEKGARMLVEIPLGRRTLIKLEEPDKPPGQPGEDEPDAGIVAVPDVVGQLQEQALESLKAEQLNVGELKTEPVPDQVGQVLSQDPAAGTRVDAGAVVNLVIAVAGNAKVPDVVGIKLDSAKRKIKKHRFTVDKIGYRVSPEIGIVLGQEPRADTMAAPGTGVSLVVGRKAEDG